MKKTKLVITIMASLAAAGHSGQIINGHYYRYIRGEGMVDIGKVNDADMLNFQPGDAVTIMPGAAVYVTKEDRNAGENGTRKTRLGMIKSRALIIFSKQTPAAVVSAAVEHHEPVYGVTWTENGVQHTGYTDGIARRE